MTRRRITPRPYTDKQGTTRWRVRFRYDTGQSTSRTFDDAQSANTFSTLIYDLGVDDALSVLEEWSTARAGTYTVEEWLLEHIDTRTGIQADTRKTYRRYVERDFTQWRYLPITALTAGHVAKWVNDQVDAGWSGKTIANKHGFLAGAMQAAQRGEVITIDPCANTRLPRTEVEDMVFLTQDEYTRFLDYFTPHWQPLIAVLFGTGLRFGEATALRVKDVALGSGAISVVRAWKRGRVLGPPKSRMSRRTIALAPETVEVLAPLVEGRPGDQFVFTNTQGNPVRHATFMENVWTPGVRLANGEPAQQGKRVGRRRDSYGKIIEPAAVALGKRPTPHDARHTCASWLLAAGVPINIVQAHLGHESVNTTVGTYGHIMPAARQAVAGAMSMALTAAHPQLEG